MLPVKFLYIGLQEIWSIGKLYELPGYDKFEYRSRDMNKNPNPNCGGGVGFFLSTQFPDYQILEKQSTLLPGVYESIWVKVKVTPSKCKIIGHVFRPNSAPKADMKKAILIPVLLFL